MDKPIPQELYNEILRCMPIACVDIVILSKGHALLVHRKDAPARNQWWLPGGRVFKGDTLANTAVRKAMEETGIACNVGTIIHTEETIFDDGPNDIPVHSINVCVLVTPEDPSPVPALDGNHADWRWVNHVETNLDPYIRRCLFAAGLREADEPRVLKQ